ncbi:MAG: hypothetical protein ACKO13_06555 [Cytophagales bacterium]
MAFKEQDDINQDKENEDNFGLPAIDYKPLDNLEEKTEQVASSFDPAPDIVLEFEHPPSSETIEKGKEEKERDGSTLLKESPSKAPIIIGVIITLLVLLTSFLVYQYMIVPKAEKDRFAKIEQENAIKAKEEADRIAREQEEERRRLEAEQAVAKAGPAVGTIESLTAPTGRYYVVVASAIDADLVMDYAKKLSAKGVSTKIIPPFGKTKFSRITLSDHDSFTGGQTAADAAKAEYGTAVWVIKY